MTSLGIMTLSRGPYSELDKMSLFQDLKLKRRKVDSRCSSDGESIADTSTSSPDLLAPISPKMCDNTATPAPAAAPTSAPSTPTPPTSEAAPSSSTPTGAAESSDAGAMTRSSPDSVVAEESQVATSSTIVAASSSGSTPSVIRSVKTERLSPPPPADRPKPPTSTPQQHVTVLVTPSRIKTENHHATLVRKTSPAATAATMVGTFPIATTAINHQRDVPATSSGASYTPVMIQTTSAHQQQLQMLHHAIASTSPQQISHRAETQPTSVTQLQIPIQISQAQPVRIKRERSPSHTIVNQAAVAASVSPSQSGSQQRATLQMTPHSPLQLRHPIRDAAILLRVKNEVNLPGLVQTAGGQHRMIWGANTRINGVKPEIIGGPLPGLRPQALGVVQPPTQNAPQVNPTQSATIAMQTPPPRATPTVIMGESCGVRTMVWGFEPAAVTQLPPTSATTISPTSVNTPPGAAAQNNEEAAQLLLNLGQAAASRVGDIRPRAPPPPRSNHPLNMERLWAGDYSQLPAGQQLHALNLSQPQWTPGGLHLATNKVTPADDDDQPLVCMICEDKATGLHYGIITCEGCKGFFKRTVQNRRVYTCVADGTCEITKAQRNRCQYCRFKKCIEQGMVLQAVREDRMPGGRNSGAVYNLYKVKYKKHKKSAQKPATQAKLTVSTDVQDTKSMFLAPVQTSLKPAEGINLPSHLVNGTILKTALTNPSEIVHLRHRLDNAVSSSKDRSVSYEHSLCMIQTLIECDEMEDIATLPHFPEFLEDKSEIGDKLCNIGDSIVHKLVSWTKKLPFYLEIPVEIHTKLLTDKWHELLVLTTAAYQALHGKKSPPGSNASTPTQQSSSPTSRPITPEKNDPEFVQEVTKHLCTLQTCLTTLMGQPISMEQLRADVGHMVEKMTQITIMFRRIKLKMEEYVCLKVYILLNREVELESIQERYVQVLRSFLQNSSPHNPGRLGDLLAHIPEIQAAASLLLESKMFYVPFVLNSASIR
ncbi:hormone receptor 4 [Phlebotomus argentipes]|uniref:hormone receptor 4 n=1 Tax=Phlebotomus argentipes TaxID=94469 RepID=UPI0028934860|nr:hormone receptor 4 [Phlebotomus argentipes]